MSPGSVSHPIRPVQFSFIPTRIHRLEHAVYAQYYPALGPLGWAVYKTLLTHANWTTLTCFPKQTTLAREARVCPATVSKYLGLLAELGLITVRRRWLSHSRRTSNMYTLIDATSPQTVARARTAYAAHTAGQGPGAYTTALARCTRARTKRQAAQTLGEPGRAARSTVPETAGPPPLAAPPTQAPAPCPPPFSGPVRRGSIPIARSDRGGLATARPNRPRTTPQPPESRRALPHPPVPPPAPDVEPHLCPDDPTHGMIKNYCEACTIHDPKPGPEVRTRRHRWPLAWRETVPDDRSP